jgi:hypothetical protein
MSIAIAVVTETYSPLPPAVAIRVAAFLATGATGKIVLNVKTGEIRSVELSEFVDARAPLDETSNPMPRSER